MSANLQSHQHNPTIKSWLDSATLQLTDVGVPSASLDAEVLLAFVFQKDRTFLHSYPEKTLEQSIVETANKLLDQRLKRIPIAYIAGFKEFYGRDFVVNKSTLIPRPESEAMIDILSEILLSTNYHLPPTNLTDIGTGSGCIGITCKLEFPKLSVTLSDIDENALKIAKENAKNLQADVEVIQSNLLANIKPGIDIITANMPYVDRNWDVSVETKYEPELALFAEDDGLEIIKKLLTESVDYLNNNGYILIESDPIQHQPIIDFANKLSFELTNKSGYVIALRLQN